MALHTYDEARLSSAENGPRDEGVRLAGKNTKLNTAPNSAKQVRTALLHCEGHHGFYGASFAGERLVRSSRNAETDLCRALVERGLSGSLRFLDAHTGALRFVVHDIERAAQHVVEEGSNGPRFKPLRQRSAR